MKTKNDSHMWYGLFILAICGGLNSKLYAEDIKVTSLKEIRERGVVMQQWENSCAAASIATVLTFGFADPITERYVSLKMLEKTNPDQVKKQGGFSLLDMKYFVEDRGYEALAFRNLSLKDLDAFNAPIVPIDHFGYHHYVVYNGTYHDKVMLADPGFGNRALTTEAFNKMWMNGMAFTVTKKK
jgi:predicted double-glycine peptidase